MRIDGNFDPESKVEITATNVALSADSSIVTLHVEANDGMYQLTIDQELPETDLVFAVHHARQAAADALGRLSMALRSS